MRLLKIWMMLKQDKLLFGGAKVRECELKVNNILTITFHKLVMKKKGTNIQN